MQEITFQLLYETHWPDVLRFALYLTATPTRPSKKVRIHRARLKLAEALEAPTEKPQ